MNRRSAAILATLMVTPALTTAAGDRFRRLGDDTHRLELALVETHPFPAASLASLGSWSDEPIEQEDLEGRVLVLLAWDSAEPRSLRLLPALARLERENSEDLVCLAIHGPEHWEWAQEKIRSGRIRAPVAHDEDGSLLRALAADEHPNLYLVDRAGNVRLADLDPRDLNRAVAALTQETPEEARADLGRRIERLAELSALARKANPDPRADDNTAQRPDLPDSVYAAAPWPEPNTRNLNALDFQGKYLAAPAGTETWLTPEPDRPVKDHVLVLDFWATWCGPCIRASPGLDELQKAHKGELLVLGMAGQAIGSKYPEDEETIRRFIEKHPVSYSHLHDAKQTVYRLVRPTAIPHVVVISTDGVVRWQGNPLDPRFRDAVERVIAADPMLEAVRTGKDEPP